MADSWPSLARAADVRCPLATADMQSVAVLIAPYRKEISRQVSLFVVQGAQFRPQTVDFIRYRAINGQIKSYRAALADELQSGTFVWEARECERARPAGGRR